MPHTKHTFLLIPIFITCFQTPVFSAAMFNQQTINDAVNMYKDINSQVPTTQSEQDPTVVESNIRSYEICETKRNARPGTNCRQINSTWELYWNVKEGDSCNTSVCYEFDRDTMKTCKFTWENNTFRCIVNECQDGYRVDYTTHLCVIDTTINCKNKLQSSDGVKIAHYVADENAKPICQATKCIKNYELKEGTCQAKTRTSNESTALQQELEKAISELTTEFQAKVSQLQQNEGGE